MLVDFDEIELVGQFEAFYARGQPGDGFVFAQGVQGESAAFVVLGVVGLHPAESPAELGNRLFAELLVKKVGELFTGIVQKAGIEFHRLLQTPTPALSVGLGGLKTFGNRMKDRFAVGIDGCAVRFAIIAPAGFVVGQGL